MRGILYFLGHTSPPNGHFDSTFQSIPVSIIKSTFTWFNWAEVNFLKWRMNHNWCSLAALIPLWFIPKTGPFYRHTWGKLAWKYLHDESVFWSLSFVASFPGPHLIFFIYKIWFTKKRYLFERQKRQKVTNFKIQTHFEDNLRSICRAGLRIKIKF